MLRLLAWAFCNHGSGLLLRLLFYASSILSFLQLFMLFFWASITLPCHISKLLFCETGAFVLTKSHFAGVLKLNLLFVAQLEHWVQSRLLNICLFKTFHWVLFSSNKNRKIHSVKWNDSFFYTEHYQRSVMRLSEQMAQKVITQHSDDKTGNNLKVRSFWKAHSLPRV